MSVLFSTLRRVLITFAHQGLLSTSPYRSELVNPLAKIDCLATRTSSSRSLTACGGGAIISYMPHLKKNEDGMSHTMCVTI